MIKRILDMDLKDFQLVPGMVIQLQETETLKIHNMVVINLGDKLIALEVYTIGESLTIDEYTRESYCYIDRDKYPYSLGISPSFGDYTIGIYPHLGICYSDEDVYEVVYKNENGQLMIKMKSE